MNNKYGVGIGLSLLASVCMAGFQGGADALIQRLDPNAYLGVQVVDLTTGALLYSRHASDRFIPASNMKLFSDAAALMVLGPDYRFVNRLSTDAKQLQRGDLQGSLYVSLSGDPSLSHQRLQHLFSELKKWNIHHIHGDIIIDSTHTGIASSAPGWVKKDLSYSYGAPISPVIVDANRLMATVNPGAQVGAPAVIEVNDPSGTVTVVNHVVTKASMRGCGIGLALNAQNQLIANGCIGKNQWALQHLLPIHSPFLYAQGVMHQQLKRMNITLDGQIRLGHMPAGTLLLSKESSKPVAQLLADTLKTSDNLYADSLFLHAAYVLKGAPLGWEAAQPVVKAFLQSQTGLDLSQSVLIDGSGLSRLDRLTPAQTAGLLQFLYQKFPLTYEYIAALPVSGRDGTLASRLKRPNQQDFIRAKTGTMAGVNSLSGYIYTANGHTLAFAIFSNRRPHVNPRISGRVMIDALCNYFLVQEPGNISWAKFFTAHKRLSFQQQLTQAQRQRQSQARWRGLESAVKAALNGQSVGVVFRSNELLVLDGQADSGRVYRALQAVRQQYPFAVAVSGSGAPSGSLAVLSTDSARSAVGATAHQRVWTIREVG